jgi:hypothetical protein
MLGYNSVVCEVGEGFFVVKKQKITETVFLGLGFEREE